MSYTHSYYDSIFLQPLPAETLDIFCLAGKEHDTAIVDDRRGISFAYGSLRTAASMMAGILKHHLPERGGRVALFLPPSSEFAVALFAAILSGATAAPLDYTLRELSLFLLLDELKPDVLVANTSTARKVAKLGYRVPVVVVEERGMVLSVEAPRERQSFSLDIMAISSHVRADADPDGDAILLPTSGTTGPHKFVCLSHRALAHNIRMHAKSLALQEGVTSLHALGLNYSYGIVASFLSTLFLKGRVILVGSGDARAIFDAADRHHPDVMLGTPSLFRLLLDNGTADDLAALGQIPKMGIGGDRCPPPLRSALCAAFPRVSFFVTYGLTEAGPRVATLDSELFQLKPDSVGLPLEGVEIAVVDQHGTSCPPNRRGKLLIKTPSLMNGYLGAGRPRLVEGWYDTGDLASLDHTGHLFIHGRWDRQIKYRGRRMNPSQIEYVLENHPLVLLARIEHVVGEGTEHLRAEVFHRPCDPNHLKRELAVFCRKNLPASLVPKEITTFPEYDACFFKGKRFALPTTVD